jgi:hypothetical protein
VELARERDGRGAVLRLAHDVEVFLSFEDRPEASPDERLVVGDDDADHAVLVGRRARTQNHP